MKKQALARQNARPRTRTRMGAEVSPKKMKSSLGLSGPLGHPSRGRRPWER
jgi:hypothetical protein